MTKQKLLNAIKMNPKEGDFQINLGAFLPEIDTSFFWDDDFDFATWNKYVDIVFGLNVEFRKQLQRHVYAYYEDFTELAGFDWMEVDFIEPIQREEDVWRLVQGVMFRVIQVYNGCQYLIMSCDVAWEGEHGMDVIWLNGEKLVQVGACEGGFIDHTYGYVGPLGRVIYSSFDPDYRTYELPIPLESKDSINEEYEKGIAKIRRKMKRKENRRNFFSKLSSIFERRDIS